MSTILANTITTFRHIDPLLESNPVLKNHAYAHGGGFGASTEVIADPVWGEILKKVEPALYDACDKVLNAHQRLLNAASAGKIVLLMENSPVAAAYAKCKIGNSFLPELDIWIDPATPKAVDKAKVTHGNLAAAILSKLPFIGKRVWNCRLLGANLVSAYSVKDWFEKYQEALLKAVELRKGEEAAKMLKEKDIAPLGVCLDMKSPWSTAEDVAGFIKKFQKEMSCKVKFVGTFDQRQLAKIDGEQGILFFHAIWDLELAASKGCLLDQVMFNGADLLVKEGGKYKIDQLALERLEKIMEDQGIKVGIYVQEPGAETEAVQKLIDLVEIKKKDLFLLGFALGNSGDGKAPRMIKGNGAGVQASLMSTSWFIPKLFAFIEKGKNLIQKLRV